MSKTEITSDLLVVGAFNQEENLVFLDGDFILRSGFIIIGRLEDSKVVSLSSHEPAQVARNGYKWRERAKGNHHVGIFQSGTPIQVYNNKFTKREYTNIIEQLYII